MSHEASAVPVEAGTAPAPGPPWWLLIALGLCSGACAEGGTAPYAFDAPPTGEEAELWAPGISDGAAVAAEWAPSSEPAEAEANADAAPHGGEGGEVDQPDPTGLDAAEPAPDDAAPEPRAAEPPMASPSECADPARWPDPLCIAACLADPPDCGTPACNALCHTPPCAAYDGCLIAQGCACGVGDDCPTDPEGQQSCREACTQDSGCEAECRAIIGPAGEQAVDAWQACLEAVCADDGGGTCGAYECPETWAGCALAPAGGSTCAELALCLRACPSGDVACEQGCALNASPDAWLAHLALAACVDLACPSGEPLCAALAEATLCHDVAAPCVGAPPGQSCNALWSCLGDEHDAEGAADCLRAIPFVATHAMAPLVQCAWDACYGASGAPSACAHGLPPACLALPPCSSDPILALDAPCLPLGCANAAAAHVRVAAMVELDLGGAPAGLYLANMTSSPLASAALPFGALTPYRAVSPGLVKLIVGQALPGGGLKLKGSLPLLPLWADPGLRYSLLLGPPLGSGGPIRQVWVDSTLPPGAPEAPLCLRAAYLGPHAGVTLRLAPAPYEPGAAIGAGLGPEQPLTDWHYSAPEASPWLERTLPDGTSQWWALSTAATAATKGQPALLVIAPAAKPGAPERARLFTSFGLAIDLPPL